MTTLGAILYGTLDLALLNGWVRVDDYVAGGGLGAFVRATE
jgi:hypothetical protein